MKVINWTLHPLHISKGLDITVEEPKFDKSRLVMGVKKIDSEFDRILDEVCPNIHRGEYIVVGGHPLLVHILITACMIKGATPFMTVLLQDKTVKKLYRVKTYFDIDRKHRLELENTDIY